MDKYSYSEHFLDSNIILGTILEWDHFHADCCDYFKEDMNKNASKKVYKECQTVLSRLKRIQKTFIEEFNKFCEKKHTTDFERELNYFKHNYITKYYAAFKLSENRFRSIVNAFVTQCHSSVLSSAKDPFALLLFQREIDDAFLEAKKELNITCYKSDLIIHDTFPTTYNTIFPRFEMELETIGIHESDRKIILDCYFLINRHIGSDMAFITSDNTILDASTGIETLLIGMHVFSLT